MKFEKVGNSKPSTGAGIQNMTDDMHKKLDGLTINEALAKGLIDDLGTDNGTFAVPHKDENIDAWYAIVQHSIVRLSKRAGELCAAGQMDDNIIGTLKFQRGISTVEGDGFNKPWFNLGLGGTVNVDLEAEDAVRVGAEPVDARK